MKLDFVAAAAVSALLAAPAAFAQTVQYACVSGSTTRAVELSVPGRDGRACEVVYRKPQEGVMEQVLWSANFDAEYCAPKAEGLVERLRGLGWDCAQIETPDGAAERASAAAGPEDPRRSESPMR
ncbi:MAG: hypothetical protein Tsb0010_08300 [Parvularculaceae bacterium]